MGKSLADALVDVSEITSRARTNRDQRQNNLMDRLLRQAQISEAGYDIQGDNLVQRPDYVSSKQAQAKKDIMESEMLGMKLNRMKRAMQPLGASGDASPLGGGQPLGTGLPQGYTSYIDPDTGETKVVAEKKGDDSLTAGQRLQKDKATQAIFDMVEQNKVKRGQIADARQALPNVPQGLMGKMEIGFKKMFKPEDPMLADWQKIKAIGTDAQLLNTARTKGAISDKEMALFATAAANDDLLSAPRLKPILDRLDQFISAEESAKIGGYKKIYNEDPNSWLQEPVAQTPKQKYKVIEVK